MSLVFCDLRENRKLEKKKESHGCFIITLKEVVSWSVHTDLGSLIGNQNVEISEYFCSQILCEINFDHVEGPKTAILTIWPALNFEFLGIFDIFKSKIPKKSKFKAS